MIHLLIKVVNVDTNLIVIVIDIYYLPLVSKLWVEFGTGGDRYWYPIHIYANLLLFCYSFTGCDTVSRFAVKGKEHVGTYGNVFQKSLAHL